MRPSVSVVVPCYNSSETVTRAVHSALVQSMQVSEVICVDDGSTDNTSDLVESITDARVRLLRQDNRGAPSARNHGLSLAGGDFVQFLDADDELLPSKIERQLDFAVRTQADVICGSYRRRLAAGGEHIVISDQHGDDWLNLIDKSCGITSANLYKREKLDRVGGWNEYWPSSQEYELMFRLLAAQASFAYHPEPLTVLYERDGSISSVFTVENRERYVRLRAEIVEYLNATGELIGQRRDSALEMVFSLVRMLYPFSSDVALDILSRCVPHGYVPPVSRVNTRPYVWAYRLLGFERAEKLRQLTATLSRDKRLPEARG